MEISTIICTLAGALLGVRFRALVIVPAILFAIAIVAVSGMARGDSATGLALAMIVAAISLQVGYIGGCILGATVTAARGSNKKSAVLPTLGMSKSV